MEPVSTNYVVAPVLDGLRGLSDESVGVVVTSPPYWGRRRYTARDDELGTEDLDDYLERLVEIFAALRPKLCSDAVVWLNLGDTSSGSGGSGGDYGPSGSRSRHLRYRQGRSGLGRMQWCSVPHRVVHELQSDGWLLRSAVVWDKTHRRPEPLSHVRRPGESHEYVFMLTASVRYGFDPAALVEQGSVWHVGVDRSRTGHPAPMPVALARRCIEPCTSPGLVLDPFAGSGAVLAAAAELQRDSVGIDFDAAAFTAARARLAGYGVELTASTATSESAGPAGTQSK
jgi:site-specific DNA-methyltransferase (cytosine-N4-specific)